MQAFDEIPNYAARPLQFVPQGHHNHSIRLYCIQTCENSAILVCLLLLNNQRTHASIVQYSINVVCIRVTTMETTHEPNMTKNVQNICNYFIIGFIMEERL
jgi:hypothetical protein